MTPYTTYCFLSAAEDEAPPATSLILRRAPKPSSQNPTCLGLGRAQASALLQRCLSSSRLDFCPAAFKDLRK